MEKKDIRALSKEELREFFVTNNDKAFRGNQVYEWLWSKGAHSFEDMTNVAKATRSMLEDNFVINHIKVDTMQRSSDGTVKNAVRLHDGLVVESVLIPTQTRTTACVSSQVGCSLDCNFCATARLKRMRNLEPAEIYDQVIAIDKESRLYYNHPLSNIVFMGMGEPLMNYNNVMKAIDMITSTEGLGMSPKRIMVSTSGIPKMIKKMADDDVKFKLADIPLPNGILRIDKITAPQKTDFTLGHYSLPELESKIEKSKLTVQGKEAYILNNGKDQLAMINLSGWDGLAFTAAEGLHPVAAKSSLINAKANFEGEKIFITLQLWKKGKKAFTKKELSPIKSFKVATDQSGVELVLRDGTIKNVKL